LYRLTKHDIYLINQAAVKRKRMTKRLDEVIIKYFDTIAEIIDTEFTVETSIGEFILYNDPFLNGLFWLYQGRYININTELGKEISSDFPMKRRITREQALKIASVIPELNKRIEENITRIGEDEK